MNRNLCLNTIDRYRYIDSKGFGLTWYRALKVPCAPKYFSSSFSYSTCTNDVGAVTHNKRRFQFRLFNHLFQIVPCFMGKSRINRWWSPSELETEIRSGTWAKRFYLWRLLSSCRAPLTWYSSPARPFAAPDVPLLVTGQQGSPPPRVSTAVQGSNACAESSLKESINLGHGTKLGRTLCYVDTDI